jgi:hypothetical protein
LKKAKISVSIHILAYSSGKVNAQSPIPPEYRPRRSQVMLTVIAPAGFFDSGTTTVVVYDFRGGLHRRQRSLWLEPM